MTQISADTPDANNASPDALSPDALPDVSLLTHALWPDVTPDPTRTADGFASFIVPAASIVAVLTFLRDQNGFSMLIDLTALDWRNPEPRFQVVYHLFALDSNATIRLKVPVSSDNPQLPTATGVFPGANWYEREVFDLFGLTFVGHPNLTRLEMPADWEGYPLRKDYPVAGPRRSSLPANQFRPIGRGDVAG